MLQIILNILAPILLMVGLGALMRWKFRIDVGTLAKLNVYLFVPAFIFDKVSTSELPWSKMGGIVAITILQVICLAIIVLAVCRLLRIDRITTAAIMLAVLFYNSGNYGLPLAQLAYPDRNTGDIQSFVIMTQNVLTFSVGMMIAATAHHGDFRQGIFAFLRLPTLTVVTAALLARGYLQTPGHALPNVISETAHWLSLGLVPVALVTLGAQLTVNPRWPRLKPVSLVLFLRLIVSPLQMAGMLLLLHYLAVRAGGPFQALDLWTPSPSSKAWPAEMLILTSSVPTAVNTLLLTLEIGGDAALAADCVFWTTVCSCITIAGWVAITRVWFA